MTVVADGLESMGLDVDRDQLADGHVVGTDGEELIWAHAPARAPHYGLAESRRLTDAEKGRDVSELSRLAVAAPGEPEPPKSVDGDLYGLFAALDSVAT